MWNYFAICECIGSLQLSQNGFKMFLHLSGIWKPWSLTIGVYRKGILRARYWPHLRDIFICDKVIIAISLS